MAKELSIESFKDMKLADFKKAFKNKAQWKKAEAVIVLVDVKIDGKKVTAAFPFKKAAQMKKAYKQAKKDKLHLPKKMGGGLFKIEKGEDGPIAKIDLLIGGLTSPLLETKASTPFSWLKLKVAATEENKQQESPETNENPIEKGKQNADSKDNPIGDQQNKTLSPEQKAKIRTNIDKMAVTIAKIKKALKG